MKSEWMFDHIILICNGKNHNKPIPYLAAYFSTYLFLFMAYTYHIYSYNFLKNYSINNNQNVGISTIFI